MGRISSTVEMTVSSPAAISVWATSVVSACS